MMRKAPVPVACLSIAGMITVAAAQAANVASEGIRLAQADESTSRQASAPARNAYSDTVLQEVIVTAQKRLERLQDVPVPLTALDSAAMEQQGKSRLEDYFASVPGLAFNAQGVGHQSIAIRGLATATIANPTVAVSIDDVPFGSSTFMGRGSESYPNIDPSDLVQIEVLRGPQGTLYGASSIGGVLKFVTAEPSTDAFTGKVQLGSTAIEQGSVGYGLSGAVNVPLSDRFAIRGSAFKRREPGYVHNISTGQRDVDEADHAGGHFTALWLLSDAVKLKVSALLQETDSDGSNAVQPSLGKLRQSGLPRTGWYRSDLQHYSAVLTADLGAVELTSVTGYTKNKSTDSIDFTDFLNQNYGFFLPFEGASGTITDIPAGGQPETYRTKRLTQELRIASQPGGRFDWLAGVFYNDESSPFDGAYTVNDPVTGAETGTIVTFAGKSTLKDSSAFANLTVHLTDRLDVQFGGRYAKIKQTYDETDIGFFGFVLPTKHTDGSAFTYLFTPRFKINDDLMAYARFASGYRPGGANVFVGAESGQPEGFEPDKAYSYEFGTKGTLLDGRLSFDASVFYIDWKNVQIEINPPGSFYRDNVGGARSKGAELSAQLRPARGLTIGAALGFTDATLTDDFPPGNTVGKAGDRLPFSSRFAGSLSVDQEFALTGSVSGTVGATLSNVGKRFGNFPQLGESRLVLPSYVTLDLHTGASYESWSVDLFLNNVTDKRALVGGGLSPGNDDDFVYYVQPRTLGLTVSKAF